MSTLTVVLVSIIVCLYELPRLIRQRQKKEMTVFVAMLVISVGLYAATQYGRLPNPVYVMEWIFKPMSDVISSWLR
ncbi:hypothetical protein PMI08_02624 [Brevibacillus sp. CF112]|uniref:hypothetical protein n=1 Tax=Brevibacillus TaxID=55080 RepID=UPI0002719953|nr:hypothetical protein [Brevibacillus sp. CF112]EJL43378.1 hypothetical protein PMI08_02624 [Brevibacillus sp. CF112]